MGDPIADQLASRLQADWGLGPISVATLPGGMNSRARLVTDGSTRWVAKSVPAAAARRFRPGLRVAAEVEAAGIPAGAPVPRSSGPLTSVYGGRTLALLTFVDGVGLTGVRRWPRPRAALIEAYATAGVLDRDEIQRTLQPMGRLRWAVQADYFARRIVANEITGIADSTENERGLEDARVALTDSAPSDDP